MTIIKASREFNKVEVYKMTQDQGAVSVKDVPDGTVLPVSGYLFYEDIDYKGENHELLSVLGEDGAVWTCQSATFKRSFTQMADLFEDEPFSIKKMSGVTKANKDYVDCCLAM